MATALPYSPYASYGPVSTKPVAPALPKAPATNYSTMPVAPKLPVSPVASYGPTAPPPVPTLGQNLNQINTWTGGTSSLSTPAFSPNLQPAPSPAQTSTALGFSNFSGQSPAAPVAPKPPITLQSNITTQSGNVVNPSTGGYVGQAPPPTLAPPTPTPYSSPMAPVTPPPITGSTPNTPATPAVPSVDSYYQDPSYLSAMGAYQNAQQLTPQEIQAQTNLNNLEASAAKAYTNAEGQAIPLEFITGQQRQLQNQATNLQQPLVNELALLQAKRVANIDATKFALDQAQTKIGQKIDVNKPVSLSMGTNLVNPATGAQVASGGSYTDKQAMDTFYNLAQQYPDANIQWNQALSAQQNLTAAQSAAQASPRYKALSTNIGYMTTPTGAQVPFNSKDPNSIGALPTTTSGQTASYTSDKSSLTDQQSYVDTTTRAINTADANFNLLLTTLGGQVNNSNSPLVNEITNLVNGRVVGDGALNQFNAALNSLRQEYSQVLAKGGVRSAATDAEAAQLIPDNISMGNLQSVYNYIKQEGANAIAQAQAQVNTIGGRIDSNSSNTSSSANVGWF